MKFWRILTGILGVLFVVVGGLLAWFISMLDDREVEGPSGAVKPSYFIIPVLLIIIGGTILFFRTRTFKFRK